MYLKGSQTMINFLIYIFLLIFLAGCSYKIYKSNTIGTDDNIESNATFVHRAISGSHDIDVQGPMVIFFIISSFVFFISFFPIFYAAYSSVKKKILTYFKK